MPDLPFLMFVLVCLGGATAFVALLVIGLGIVDPPPEHEDHCHMPLDEQTRWRIAGENLTHVRRIHGPYDWSQHVGL